MATDRNCGCYMCLSSTVSMYQTRMILCPECGNKRCPKATHHKNACTGSNESGQVGSRYGVLTDEDIAQTWENARRVVEREVAEMRRAERARNREAWRGRVRRWIERIKR